MSFESDDPASIEKLLSQREMRLPDGIRKHIRDLKKDGKLQEAIRFREESIIKKRTAKERLNDKLNLNIRDVLVSDDPERQALAAFTLVWILNKDQNISDEQRRADLEFVYRTWPEQDNSLEARGSSIVAEVSKLVKEASN